ncbi:hypothetical protein DMUE_2066 [Dictyocoela muelleri]|nr:hypothetical protein DMUE_2066 [Dictyocoela muelleri]
MTDNKNLTFLGDLSKRINRWKLILEEYDYNIVHVDGNNKEADALSRSLKISTFKSISSYKLPKFPYNEIKNLGEKFLKNKNDDKDLKNLLRKLHEQLSPPGIIRFQKLIERYRNLSFLRKIIKSISSEYQICNKEKDSPQKFGWVTHEFKVKNKKECIAIDIKGSIKWSHFQSKIRKEYLNILVMIDLFTRYTEITILFETDVMSIIDAIKMSWFDKHTPPKKTSYRQWKTVYFFQV